MLIVLILILLALVGVGYFLFEILKSIRGYRADFIATFDSNFKEKVKNYYLEMKRKESRLDFKEGKLVEYIEDRNY